MPFTPSLLSNLKLLSVALLLAISNIALLAQEQLAPPPAGPPRGGPMRQELQLVKQFDKDGDEPLDAVERKAAREFLAKERAEGRLRRGPGGRPFGGPDDRRAPGAPPPAPGADNPPAERREGPERDRVIIRRGGPRENLPPPEPGRKLASAEVKSYPAMPLYDPQTVRTFFLEFESSDWEKELTEFHHTDVEVPATLTVDGKKFRDVGINFRGASSFMMVGEGHKRSLSLTLDLKNKKQDLLGYQSLTLLNSHGDPSFLRAVLYYQIARDYLPAPKANFAHVVINGESWGVYVNKQNFNKDFIDEWFGTKKGARWKAPGSPGGGAGLEYLGDDVELYKKRYEIKSKDDPEAWTALARLCQVLNQTPSEQLEEKLQPILNIDGVLRFLALENALINNDGYWVRSSDYSLYLDPDGQFHIFPHDANETFSRPGGPGFRIRRDGPGDGRFAGPVLDAEPRERPGPAIEAEPPKGPDALPPRPGSPSAPAEVAEGNRGGGRAGEPRGVELDPLVSATDPKKPLLSKLLAVPALRERYLTYIKEIAETWLDWKKVGPVTAQYHSLIAGEVRLDTRKLASTEAFEKSIDDKPAADTPEPRRGISLKAFAEQRRAYLLNHPAIKNLQRTPVAGAPNSPSS